MRVSPSRFGGSDGELEELRELLVESYAAAGWPENWLTGRLDAWRFGANARRAAEDPGFFPSCCHLWRGPGGALAAFAISERGDGELFLQVHPRHRGRGLEDPMLDWAEREWAAGLPSLSVFADAGDWHRADILARRGYADRGPREVTRAFDLTRPFAPLRLPPGYRVSTLAATGDAAGHAALVRAALASPEVDSAWLASLERAPGYDRRWAVVVIAPGGAAASMCHAWPDERNLVAEVRPVATHPAHRRMGLARAALAACCIRLQAAGLRTAYLRTAPEGQLFGSLGPVAAHELRRWERPL